MEYCQSDTSIKGLLHSSTPLLQHSNTQMHLKIDYLLTLNRNSLRKYAEIYFKCPPSCHLPNFLSLLIVREMGGIF